MSSDGARRYRVDATVRAGAGGGAIWQGTIDAVFPPGGRPRLEFNVGPTSEAHAADAGSPHKTKSGLADELDGRDLVDLMEAAVTTRQSATLAAWQGDWQARMTERLQGHGYASATDYGAQRPAVSLLVLADELSGTQDDVAAEQIRRRLLAEAQQRGSVERCARDLLVRSLHEKLPEGWHAEWGIDVPGDRTTPIARRASALGGWTSSISVHLSEYDDTLMRVALALRDSHAPAGWLPASVDDPVLLAIFREHWHEPARK
jgi:hypothetical protein